MPEGVYVCARMFTLIYTPCVCVCVSVCVCVCVFCVCVKEIEREKKEGECIYACVAMVT